MHSGGAHAPRALCAAQPPRALRVLCARHRLQQRFARAPAARTAAGASNGISDPGSSSDAADGGDAGAVVVVSATGELAPAVELAAGGVSSGASPPVGASHPLALPEDMFAAEELVQELADPSALGKRGELLLLAQALVMAFCVWPPFKLVGFFDLCATLALVAGAVFCVYGLISLGRNFSPLASPRKNHKLVTSGLYAHCRHPLYGGLIMVALGLAALTRSEVRLALSLALWAVLEQKARAEETALAARYGADYESYAQGTKKFVPFLY